MPQLPLFSESCSKAQAWEVIRPTTVDVDAIRAIIDAAHVAPTSEVAGRGCVGTNENVDYWVPVLTALKRPLAGRISQLTQGLRKLHAGAGMDVGRLAACVQVELETSPTVEARSLSAERLSSVSDDECPIETDDSDSMQTAPSMSDGGSLSGRETFLNTQWAPLSRLAARSEAHVSVHQVLESIGEVEAAARARRDIKDRFIQAIRNGYTVGRKKPCTMTTLQDFRWLESAGLDWCSFDTKGKLPLHYMCSMEGKRLAGDAKQTTIKAILARWLCSRWSSQMLLEDADGLTPLNYLTKLVQDVTSADSSSSTKELTIALVDAFDDCIPEQVITQIRQSRNARNCVERALVLDRAAPPSRNVLPVLLSLSECGAWECAAFSWQKNVTEFRELCKMAGDVQARSRIIRSLSRTESTSEAREDETDKESVVKRLAEAEAAWKERQCQFEERIADLEAELGRIPLREIVQTSAEEGEESDTRPALMTALVAGDANVGEAPLTLATDEGRFAVQEAEECVNRIRRLRLVDTDLSSASELLREGAEKVRKVLVRAVQRLAEDLYELESHFVYELVQNADDNRYQQAQDSDDFPDLPRLRLSLRYDEGDEAVGRAPGSYFFSSNNELGLRGQDVVALCDVNASSKKGKNGYTGQKGIGWKSTFQVSDCPFMLSGAFSFKFDIAGPLGRLGYVTPTWVSSAELATLPAEVLQAHREGNTVVYLPLKTGAAESVSFALEHLEEHHSCLLFMRRLRRLEIEFPDGRSTSYEFSDDGEIGAIRLARMSGQEVVSEQRLLHLLHSYEVQLPSGDSSSLKLAFPMGPDEESNGDRDDSKDMLEPDLQALYCGLPVRRVGFRFAINGPFDLVANRGDIHEGSLVNQVLCEAIPMAFAGALRTHESKIGPRALAFIGNESANSYWRRIRARLLFSLKGNACVPTENGKLAAPETCIRRPTGVLAAAASRLIRPELLEAACGKYFANSSQSLGQLRGLGVPEFGLDHWLAIFSYRNDTSRVDNILHTIIESGSAGATDFFRTFFAWLDEELRSAEKPGEILGKLWKVKFIPVSTGKLVSLSDGPIFDRYCKDIPSSWQETLCVEGVLRVFDPSILSGLEGGSLRFVESFTIVKPNRAVVAGLCLEWHLMCFPCSTTQHGIDAIWASVACLMEVFYAGETLHVADSLGPLTPLASMVETRINLSDWKDIGSALYIPAYAGKPELARCADLVCLSFLGVAGIPPRGTDADTPTDDKPLCASSKPPVVGPLAIADVSKLTEEQPCDEDLSKKTLKELKRLAKFNGASQEDVDRFDEQENAKKTAIQWIKNKKEIERRLRSRLKAKQQVMQQEHTEVFESRLPWPQRFICPRYLNGNWGDSIKWEPFLVALGVSRLAPQGIHTPPVVRTTIAAQLGRHLSDETWWQNVLKKQIIARYVCQCLLDSSEDELEWLRGLPVATEQGFMCCVSGLFLDGSFSALGKRYLAFAKLPSPDSVESGTSVEDAKNALRRLGVTTTVTAPALIRALQMLKTGGCQDTAYYVDLYTQFARLDIANSIQAVDLDAREALKRLIFVPGKGFVSAELCTWEDTGIIRWLAEIPTLQTVYSRYGSHLEHFFLQIAGVSRTVNCSFPWKVFAHALSRLVVQADIAFASPEAQLPGASISAEEFLANIPMIAKDLYSKLAHRCSTLTENEKVRLMQRLGHHRIIIIPDDANQPKCITVAEAWWDVEDELANEPSIAKYSLKNHYRDDDGDDPRFMENFFVDVVKVRRKLSRDSLRKQMKQEFTVSTSPSHWNGLSPHDFEDLTIIQTSSDFRSPDWRSPSEETEQLASSGGDRNTSNEFRPRQGAGPRVPPWRSREDAEQQAREEAERTQGQEQTSQSTLEHATLERPSPELQFAAAAKPKSSPAVPPNARNRRDGIESSASGSAHNQGCGMGHRGSSDDAVPRPESSQSSSRGTSLQNGAQPFRNPVAQARNPEETLRRSLEAAAERGVGLDDPLDMGMNDDERGDSITQEDIRVVQRRVLELDREQARIRHESFQLREQWVQIEDECDRYATTLQEVYHIDAASISHLEVVEKRLVAAQPSEKQVQQTSVQSASSASPAFSPAPKSTSAPSKRRGFSSMMDAVRQANQATTTKPSPETQSKKEFDDIPPLEDFLAELDSASL